MDLGSRIRRARAKKGITQHDLAKAVGITASALSGYERNIRRPNSDVLARIAQALDTTTDFLLLGNSFSGKVMRLRSKDMGTLYLKLAKTAEEAQLTEEQVNMLLAIIHEMGK